MNSNEHPTETPPAESVDSESNADVDSGPTDDAAPNNVERDVDDEHEGTPDSDALTFSGSVAIETTTDDLWTTISDPATLTECGRMSHRFVHRKVYIRPSVRMV